mmetsp:Transcript_34357/g.110903  ORF Transcript_34357/g.110903 Transcript_34357/m.110903 type:complete len:238 (-) Transcript_34357:151-864(-)
MPDDQVSRLGTKLEEVGVGEQAVTFQVDEDGVRRHGRISVRALEVDWRPVIGWRVVHGHPPAQRLVRRVLRVAAPGEGVDRPILIILVPLEALVRVNHQQVGRQPQLVGAGNVRESRGERGVVHELGEAGVGRPDRPLDVVVQPRRHAGHRPDVRVGHLPFGDASQVGKPLLGEQAGDEDGAVLEQLRALGVGHREGRRLAARLRAGGQRNYRLLQPVLELPWRYVNIPLHAGNTGA